MTTNSIVFLEVNPGHISAFAVARELELPILYVNANPDKIVSVQDECLDTRHMNRPTFEAMCDWLESRSSDHHPVGVFSTGAFSATLGWRLNHHLHPNNVEYRRQHEASIRCRDKLQFREALAGTSHNPRYEVVNRHRPQCTLSRDMDVVVKPRHGSRSIGVEKVPRGRDPRPAIDRAFSGADYIWRTFKELSPELEESCRNSILVEEYISGAEFAVDVFVEQNAVHRIGISSKAEMKPPYFEEISYCMPAPLVPTLEEKLWVAAADVVRCIGLRIGPAHMEFRVQEDRMVVLDVSPRIGGAGLTHDLAEISSGMNLTAACLAGLLARDPKPHLAARHADTALLFLTQVEGGGRVEAMPNFNSTFRGAQLVKQASLVNVGDTLSPYPLYSGLPGYALYRVTNRSAESHSTVETILNSCLLNARIQYSTI